MPNKNSITEKGSTTQLVHKVYLWARWKNVILFKIIIQKRKICWEDNNTQEKHILHFIKLNTMNFPQNIARKFYCFFILFISLLSCFVVSSSLFLIHWGYLYPVLKTLKMEKRFFIHLLQHLYLICMLILFDDIIIRITLIVISSFTFHNWIQHFTIHSSLSCSRPVFRVIMSLYVQ